MRKGIEFDLYFQYPRGSPYWNPSSIFTIHTMVLVLLPVLLLLVMMGGVVGMMAKKGSRKQVGRKRKNKGTTAKSRTAVSGRAAYVQSPKEKRPRTTFNFLGITREYMPSYMDLTVGALKLTPFSASSSSSSTSVPSHPMLVTVVIKRKIFDYIVHFCCWEI